MVAQGDSLTYGQDMDGPRRQGINGSTVPRSGTPYPEALQARLGPVRMLNEGFPGDRSIDGLARWSRAPASDLTVLMYGTNDALSQGGAVPPAQYRQALERLIARRRGAASAVVVVLPPPTDRLLANLRLAAYRRAALQAAREGHAYALDPAPALRRVDHPFADPVHLTPQGYAAIGALVAAHLRIAPPGSRS